MNRSFAGVAHHSSYFWGIVVSLVPLDFDILLTCCSLQRNARRVHSNRPTTGRENTTNRKIQRQKRNFSDNSRKVMCVNVQVQRVFPKTMIKPEVYSTPFFRQVGHLTVGERRNLMICLIRLRLSYPIRSLGITSFKYKDSPRKPEKDGELVALIWTLTLSSTAKMKPTLTYSFLLFFSFSLYLSSLSRGRCHHPCQILQVHAP